MLILAAKNRHNRLKNLNSQKYTLFDFQGSTSNHTTMRNEFTAVIEQDNSWFIAYSPEIQGVNAQGQTKEEALDSLRAAILLILEDRREDGLRGVSQEAMLETVVVE